MARKKKHEEHVNHERWLVSYADFITLLFAFFVVMYSVSSVNEGKYRVLSDALLSAFHTQPKSLDPIQVGQQSKAAVLTNIKVKITPDIMLSQQKSSNSAPENSANTQNQGGETGDEAGSDSSLDKISDDVLLAMANLIELGIINVRRNDLWLEIEINNSILFNSGSAKLKESVTPVLKELAAILYNYPNSIRVEGYTDSDSITTQLFPSNWELSSARASSIARVFELSNILSDRLSVVGYGPTRPVADNSTIEGKAKNRRVVIVIVANNDIAKTVRNKKTDATVNFPDDTKLVSDGILERDNSQIAPEPTDDVPSSPVVELSDRGISLYRDTLSGSPPEPSVKESRVNIYNPSLAPPIRLFYPIELPSPFNTRYPDKSAKE